MIIYIFLNNTPCGPWPEPLIKQTWDRYREKELRDFRGHIYFTLHISGKIQISGLKN